MAALLLRSGIVRGWRGALWAGPALASSASGPSGKRSPWGSRCVWSWTRPLGAQPHVRDVYTMHPLHTTTLCTCPGVMLRSGAPSGATTASRLYRMPVCQDKRCVWGSPKLLAVQHVHHLPIVSLAAAMQSSLHLPCRRYYDPLLTQHSGLSCLLAMLNTAFWSYTIHV